MNEENEREGSVEEVDQEKEKMRNSEVRRAFNKMKSGEMVGSDNVPMEVWKCVGEVAVDLRQWEDSRGMDKCAGEEKKKHAEVLKLKRNKDDEPHNEVMSGVEARLRGETAVWFHVKKKRVVQMQYLL